jgi:hypothetical protein
MPKITFGPNRRIGALGAYVVTFDPEKKTLSREPAMDRC